jgi:hypothetical protein
MRIKQLVLAGTLIVLGASGGAAAATPLGSAHDHAVRRQLLVSHQASTPNDCIRLNGGDYNACNVGNEGRGDLPYDAGDQRTPNDCIRLNGGDYNACNVGNSGRGDLPYQPVSSP